MNGELSNREKYLMLKAFNYGYSSGHNDTVESIFSWECAEGYECFTDWLSEMDGDGITVEMILDKEAPKDGLCGI